MCRKSRKIGELCSLEKTLDGFGYLTEYRHAKMASRKRETCQIEAITMYCLCLNWTMNAKLLKLEETSTHKSAITHIGNVFLCFVALTIDCLTPK